MKAFEDPSHIGNSKKYLTKNKCCEDGCNELAGTMWSPFWCFKHNVERIKRINGQFEALLKNDIVDVSLPAKNFETSFGD